MSKELKTNIGEIEPSGNDLINKKLEAWEEIKLGYICGQGAINEFALRENERQKLEIIESALKREDSIEITAIDIEQENQALCKENKKLKRALEIIKRNPVLIMCEFYKCVIELKMSYEEYCDYFSKNDEPSIKSKDEYYLLKEVLG